MSKAFLTLALDRELIDVLQMNAKTAGLPVSEIVEDLLDLAFSVMSDPQVFVSDGAAELLRELRQRGPEEPPFKCDN